MHRFALTALLLTLPCFAHAVQVCDLDGQHVNPANGNTTAGKTGLMRCRDGEGGPVLREQELKNGVFMGIVRYYKNGVLEKEYSVNERGNRDGRSREFAATPGAENRVLREETARNGTTIGLVRSWYPNGTLRRASFHGDDGRERAEAEFTPQGQLADLRCGPTPMLAPAADDAAWCGHAGTLASVDLYAANGQLRGRLTHERGERRRSETFWDNGKAREVAEIGRDGGSERSFTPEGQPRREQQWVAVPATPAGSEARSRRTTVLDREFSDAGTVVRERRWQPAERGALLVSDKTWYLNGQPREVQAFTAEGNLTLQSETDYHDNGKPSFQGQWKLSGRYERLAVGVHKRFDEQGRLRSERHHDDKGRVQREREFDESGGLTRDDEVYADGSRKAFSR